MKASSFGTHGLWTLARFTALSMLVACASVLGIEDHTLFDADAGGDASAEASSDASAADAPSDATPPGDSSSGCPANTADCDPLVAGCETSLLTSDSSCGTCGHDCGGTGLCQSGVCTPKIIANGVNKPASLAVSGLSVFWMVDQQIQRCPVTGCPGTPNDQADSTSLPKFGGTGPSYITADTSNVYWVGYTTDQSVYSIFICQLSGCSGNAPVSFFSQGLKEDQMVANTASLYWLDGQDGVVTRVRKIDKNTVSLPGIGALTNPGYMAVDDAHFFITDQNGPINGGGLYVCPTATDCAGGITRLLDRAEHVATNGPTAFVNQTDATGAIIACDFGGCGGSGTILTTGEHGVSAMAADTSNVYWAIRGTVSDAGPPDGTIRACSLPDCKGGARTIAPGQAFPRSLVQDANFVYWANQGTSAGNSGQIVRVRK